MEIIKHSDYLRWNQLVRSFDNYDVYYMNGYVEGFRLHGDGEPILLYYEQDGVKAMCVFMIRDIAGSELFEGKLPKRKYYDAITPYGYGGFIIEGDASPDKLESIYNEYIDKLREFSVVSVFFRFHPMLNNAHIFDEFSKVIDLGQTIHIELTSKDDIWNNFEGKNRTSIRKALKNGVVIKNDSNKKTVKRFIELYNATMDHDNADSYYYFNDDFYQSVLTDLPNNHTFFYAELDGKIISCAIILHANKQMHYHLSGSDYKYRNLSPSNLLLFEAACWGIDKGYKTFHLGGGIGSQIDSLFKFKRSFNKHSTNQFSIGYDIVDEAVYEELIEIRKKKDSDFDIDSKYFPLYRAK
jgi:predicted N-acyltransferase